MERKIFWISFTVLGLLADFVLPLWWALGATIPIVFSRGGWLIAAAGSSELICALPDLPFIIVLPQFPISQGQ